MSPDHRSGFVDGKQGFQAGNTPTQLCACVAVLRWRAPEQLKLKLSLGPRQLVFRARRRSTRPS